MLSSPCLFSSSQWFDNNVASSLDARNQEVIMFIKRKKVGFMSVLGELFHFQCKANLLFLHKTNCDADSRPKHITGYLQAEVTNTVRIQE